MNTNKLQVFVFAMLFVVGAFTGCVDEDDETTTDNSIKIGFLNPITGPLEPDAPGFKWGADQAISDLAKMYPNETFKLIELDSGCSGDVAGPAAQTLVDSGVVAVVGAACSGASMSANAVLAAAGIPMISYASTNPGLSDEAEYPLFYRVVPSDALGSLAIVDMMEYQAMDTSGLAILHMNNHEGELWADTVETAWENADNSLCNIGVQSYEETATDFSALVENIVNDDTCATVFLASYMNDAALIIEELHNQNWDGEIYSGEGSAGTGLYEIISDHTLLDGFMVADRRAGSSYGNFEQRYDDSADEIGGIKEYILTAYDSVMIMGKAIAGLDDAYDLEDRIEIVGTNYEGASGMINFLDNGDGTGQGYDVCTYSGDPNDENEGYLCNLYWTIQDGLQQY